MAGSSAKSDKKDRHRKSSQNTRYKNEHRHEKSHIKRLKKHLETQPDDKKAKAALSKYQTQAGIFR